LVVVDFIDMRSAKHRRDVEKTMRDSMKDDRARTYSSRLSENGLLEINRQRLKKALQLRTHRPCPTCSGTGNIASPEFVGLSLLRRIETRAVTGRLGGVRVELHPELADALQNERRQELAALEREFDIEIEIIAASGLHRAEEHIEWRERTKGEERVIAPAVSAADLGADIAGKKGKSGEPARAAATEAPETGGDESKAAAPKKRRRRGGRKHKKSKGAEKRAENGSDAPEESDHSAKSDATVDADEGKPAPKKRRRRPRRSKKKTAAAVTPVEEAAPTPDPFSY
jgi:ribonuclease E